MNIQAVIEPHEEGHKGMQKEKRQTKITSFYIKSSVCPNQALQSTRCAVTLTGFGQEKRHKKTPAKKKKPCLFIINLFSIIFHLLLVSLAPIFFPTTSQIRTFFFTNGSLANNKAYVQCLEVFSILDNIGPSNRQSVSLTKPLLPHYIAISVLL